MVEDMFEVVRVEQDLVRNYKQHFEPFFKKSTQRGQDKYKVSQYKVFYFNSQHPYEVEVSSSMMTLSRLRFGLLKPNARSCLPPNRPCYSAPIPVKPAKKKDVEKLKKYLKEEHRALVDQLVTSNDADSENDNSDYDD